MSDAPAYTKVWTDESGWTAGVGKPTPNVFGSEPGLVITGNNSTQVVTSTVTDGPWGDTIRWDTQFRFSADYSDVMASFRVRRYSFRLNNQSGAIELVDNVGKVVGSIPYL